MSDVLIRDVPDDVLSAIDAHATRLGLSRTEYLRRRLAQEMVVGEATVSTEHLQAFARDFADLADPDVMSGAWE
jgi:hypothetical protein